MDVIIKEELPPEVPVKEIIFTTDEKSKKPIKPRVSILTPEVINSEMSLKKIAKPISLNGVKLKDIKDILSDVDLQPITMVKPKKSTHLNITARKGADAKTKTDSVTTKTKNQQIEEELTKYLKVRENYNIYLNKEGFNLENVTKILSLKNSDNEEEREVECLNKEGENSKFVVISSGKRKTNEEYFLLDKNRIVKKYGKKVLLQHPGPSKKAKEINTVTSTSQIKTTLNQVKSSNVKDFTSESLQESNLSVVKISTSKSTQKSTLNLKQKLLSNPIEKINSKHKNFNPSKTSLIPSESTSVNTMDSISVNNIEPILLSPLDPISVSPVNPLSLSPVDPISINPSSSFGPIETITFHPIETDDNPTPTMNPNPTTPPFVISNPVTLIDTDELSNSDESTSGVNNPPIKTKKLSDRFLEIISETPNKIERSKHVPQEPLKNQSTSRIKTHGQNIEAIINQNKEVEDEIRRNTTLRKIWEMKLESMNKFQRLHAEHLINQVLFKGMLMNLNANTKLYIPNDETSSKSKVNIAGNVVVLKNSQ